MLRLGSTIFKSLLAIGFLIATMPCLCEAMVEKQEPSTFSHSCCADHDADHNSCDHCDHHSIHDCMNQKAEPVHSGFSFSMKIMGTVTVLEKFLVPSLGDHPTVPVYSPPKSPPSLTSLRI